MQMILARINSHFIFLSIWSNMKIDEVLLQFYNFYAWRDVIRIVAPCRSWGRRVYCDFLWVFLKMQTWPEWSVALDVTNMYARRSTFALFAAPPPPSSSGIECTRLPLFSQSMKKKHIYANMFSQLAFSSLQNTYMIYNKKLKYFRKFKKKNSTILR